MSRDGMAGISSRGERRRRRRKRRRSTDKFPGEAMLVLGKRGGKEGGSYVGEGRFLP